MTVTGIKQGSVRFSWTNNSLPTDPCPERQINELSSRLISADTGQINPEFREAMKPYQLLGASVTPLGACALEPPDVPTVSSTTSRDDAGPLVSGLAEYDPFLLVIVIAVSVMAALFIILIIIIIIFCCRRQRRLRSEKQQRAADDELSCANKGIPVIFADELLDDDNDADDEQVRFSAYA